MLDLSLPGASGLDLLKDLRVERPSLPVLVLSVHAADQFARRAISAGASGYITKDRTPAEVVQAVRTVIAGRRYLDPTLSDEFESGPDHPPADTPHERLSDREYQVMRMIASGRRVSQIAAELSLSVHSVSTYRARVLAKMELKSTAELMRYAIQRGLVD